MGDGRLAPGIPDVLTRALVHTQASCSSLRPHGLDLCLVSATCPRLEAAGGHDGALWSPLNPQGLAQCLE